MFHPNQKRYTDNEIALELGYSSYVDSLDIDINDIKPEEESPWDIMSKKRDIEMREYYVAENLFYNLTMNEV